MGYVSSSIKLYKVQKHLQFLSKNNLFKCFTDGTYIKVFLLCFYFLHVIVKVTPLTSLNLDDC